MSRRLDGGSNVTAGFRCFGSWTEALAWLPAPERGGLA